MKKCRTKHRQMNLDISRRCNMSTKLTQNEADMLIEMLKESMEKVVKFPISKGKVEFEARGQDKKDTFIVNISRKGINSQGASYQGRHPRSGEILLRLDINPTAVHLNPDGEKIEGSHIHIYSEEFGARFAMPFDTEDKNLRDLCMEFFDRFNLIEQPEIDYQGTQIQRTLF